MRRHLLHTLLIMCSRGSSINIDVFDEVKCSSLLNARHAMRDACSRTAYEGVVRGSTSILLIFVAMFGFLKGKGAGEAATHVPHVAPWDLITLWSRVTGALVGSEHYCSSCGQVRRSSPGAQPDSPVAWGIS